MEKIIGIFDEQNTYAERLKRYINERKDIGCVAVSFKEEKELEEYCGRKKMNYLVVGSGNADKMHRLPLPYGVRIWVLSEEAAKEDESDGYQTVFRYQKAGQVIRRIMQAELAREQRLSELYTVFSPESSMLAADYAGKLIGRLAENGKTLFLPWDSFGGFGRAEDGGRMGASVSELLYFIRKDREQAKQLFAGLPKMNGAFFFCSPEYCTDLWQYSPEEMHQLVNCCREYGGYQYVVFLAEMFHAGVISVMNQSGKVYLVSSDTEDAAHRKNEFYRQMKYAGEQGVLSQLQEVVNGVEV